MRRNPDNVIDARLPNRAKIRQAYYLGVVSCLLVNNTLRVSDTQFLLLNTLLTRDGPWPEQADCANLQSAVGVQRLLIPSSISSCGMRYPERRRIQLVC